MNNIKTLLFVLIAILNIENFKAQNHLEPVESIFNLYDFQLEYYPKVINILFEGLSDNPEIRYLVMPSFSGENVFEITKDNTSSNYFINYNTVEPSVWHSIQSRNVNVKLKKIKKEVSQKDAELIIFLFKKALSTVKYPETERNGLDGKNYFFFSNHKSGTVWSPKLGSKMSKLVEICDEIIQFSKNKKQNLDNELVLKINNLINELQETD